MPVEAARLAPCPAIANEDIAGWPSRAYRLCGGGATIYVAAASWLAPRAHIGVGHSKTPSGAQGRPAGDPAARASSRPGRIGRMGARSAGGIAPGRPSPLHYSKKQLVRRLEQSIAKRTTIDASPEGLPIGRPRTAFRPCPKRARGVLPTRAPLFPTTDRKLPGLPPR